MPVKPLYFLEANNGLCARIIEQSHFDGIWVSSLTDSASRGLPDIELVSSSDRLEKIREIRGVSTKPIIVDWDTGGDIRHFPYWVKQLNSTGVYGIVIEDKAFPKINSLIEGQQVLEDVDKFCEKIKAGKWVSNNTLIIARLESLIAKKSINDALIRAGAYLDAGADGILIHSKKEISANEVMEFAKRFRVISDKPLIAIPTTYQLPQKHPFNIVIYANHLLRASLKSMLDYVKNPNDRKLAPLEDIFKLTGDIDKTK